MKSTKKMGLKRIILSLLFLSVVNIQAFTQKADHFHSWWVYDGNFRLHDRLSVNALYAWSRNDYVKNWQQSLTRIGLNYDHRKNLTFSGGYEWIERFPYGEQPLPRQIAIHRFYQGITLKNKIGNIGLANILRFNQEHLNGAFRYFIINQIGLKIPVRLNKKNTRLSIRLAEAIFINHGKSANKNYFGQNRVYAGIDVLVNQSMGIDVGYLNQYIIKGNQLIENNHTLLVRLTHQMDVRKNRRH